MRTVWSGPLLLAVLLGLAGQALLLPALAGSDPTMRGPAPLFLLTILFLAIAAVGGSLSRGEGTAAGQGWLRPRILIMTAGLALQAGALAMNFAPRENASGGGRAAQRRDALQHASQTLELLLSDLDRTAAEAAGRFPRGLRPGSALFGQAVALQSSWPGETVPTFPLEVVLWSGDQRLAWTPHAAPLSPPGGDPAVEGLEATDRFLEASNGRWYLREAVPLEDAALAELQVGLPGILPGSGPVTVALEVISPREAARRERSGRDRGHTFNLVAGDGEPVLWLAAQPSPANPFRRRDLSLLMLAAGWLVILLAALAVRRPTGRQLLLLTACAWLARDVLACLDLANRIATLDPGRVFPVPPASLLSLLDPAYFATPVLGGWLASSADALISALVVLGTAAALWRAVGWPRLVGNTSAWRPGAGRGPGAALVFGLGTALVLGALEFLTGLVTTNANPRMVGTGIPLASASFWVLHLTLMVVSLAAIFVLALMLTAWRGRPQGSGPVAGLLAAPAGALLLTQLVPWYSAAERVLAAFLALAFWLLIPGLGRTTRLLRRLTLPAMLMLVVLWNHTVLRDLDGRAERRWLENKAEAITSVDEDWTRFLLGSVLEDMLKQEEALPEDPSADIWRDEPAWRLWKDSALEDLGGACLVELLDPAGAQESLMARGFLRQFQYEVSRRTARVDRNGQPPQDGDITFQVERRLYSGGEEQVLIGEAPRPEGRGWIRVEMPLRSWRVSTLKARLRPPAEVGARVYRPRVEAAGSLLLVQGDDGGWRQASDNIFPDPGSAEVVAALKTGRMRWGRVTAGGRAWRCLWQPLPSSAARFPGEGFLIGLEIPGLSWQLLDLSRLMLLNLVFFFLGRALVWVLSAPESGSRALRPGARWRVGFQERFLGGYLVLGLFLLLVVGMSVDQAGYQSVRAEARSRTRQGLAVAVEQLRSLLVEQARSLAGSEYIADMLLGQLAGHRPAGPVELRQGMVFDGRGDLLLDETLSDLDDRQARALLDAGREAPLVVIRNGDDLFVGAVIPIDLTDILAAPGATAGPDNRSIASDGFFLYRQRLDEDLLVGLAELVQGEASLSVGGRPLVASHPEEFFAGHEGRLTAAGMMADLLLHPGSPGIFAGSDRPFAFTGAMPLPVFEVGRAGWRQDALPAVLALSFPDREREFTTRRTETVLFLTGLATLILLTAMVLAGILAWSIFRPLQLLAEATRSLAAGDFRAPLPTPGHDEVGELTAAFGAMRAQLHTARERLAARERFLSLVLEQVPVGVGVVDDAGRLVVLNPAGRRILSEFNPGAEAADALLALRDRIGGVSPDEQGGEVRGSGGRTVRGAVAPLELPGDRTDTMVVFEDITDFLVNKKLALSAELARQVAHEIKNPLTPIRLSAQLLGQAWRDRHERLDEIVPDAVQRILDQVDLLRRIASEFSLLGRPDQLEIAPVDLSALVADVAAAYASGGYDAGTATGPPRVEIQDAPVPGVMANAESLQKILGNLMQNSLDAAVPGGPARVEVSWRWDEATVTLVWRDYGTGIPADVADHLFDPYFSTKTRGTGLGLAICRSLVDRMGGSITLANCSDGPGAVATLVLPRAGLEDAIDEDP